MAFHKVRLANAASIFVRQLRGDDQFMAASFANEIDVMIEPTKVKDLQKKLDIRQFPRDNNTMLFDAVDFAMKKMRKIRGRKAIILFSDGAGTPLFASAKGNLQNALEQEALIYTIQFNTFEEPPPKSNKKEYNKTIDDANYFMSELPKRTGGKHYRLENIANLEETFAGIANELGRQYRLGYYPKMEGKPSERREISVKVSLPNVAVRSRSEVVYKKK